jgi:hypothetical protein
MRYQPFIVALLALSCFVTMAACGNEKPSPLTTRTLQVSLSNVSTTDDQTPTEALTLRISNTRYLGVNEEWTCNGLKLHPYGFEARLGFTITFPAGVTNMDCTYNETDTGASATMLMMAHIPHITAPTAGSTLHRMTGMHVQHDADPQGSLVLSATSPLTTLASFSGTAPSDITVPPEKLQALVAGPGALWLQTSNVTTLNAPGFKAMNLETNMVAQVIINWV